MKRIFVLFVFFLSLSETYAQSIDVIHLKNGFDARGTITNRTESQITLQSEYGQTLSINICDIASMEQEQKNFDPKVLIGCWACYKASGERDERFDMEIRENEGFYTVSYNWILEYDNSNSSLAFSTKKHEDIDVQDGKISYEFHNIESWSENAGTKIQRQMSKQIYDCNVTLQYVEGKLKGSIDCFNYFFALGNSNYKSVASAIEHGCGTVHADGPGGKWNVYFVKH